MTPDAASVTAPPWDPASLDLPTLAPEEIAALTTQAIASADERIDAALAAIGDARVATFEELFGALDDAAREVAIAFGRGAAQSLMAEDDAVRAAAFAASEQIEKWRGALPSRGDLGAAIERYVGSSDLAGLATDEQAYVRRWEADVRLAGAGLAPEAREEVARLTGRLVELGNTFAANVIANPHLEVATADLDGLAPGLVATFQQGSAPDTVDVPVNYANFFAIMERAANRGLRERTLRAWMTRGVPENVAVLDEVLAARGRIAEVLGHLSWQALRATELAAHDAATINTFIGDMGERLMPVVRRDLDAMAVALRAGPGTPDDLVVQDWDWRYADRLQREALGVDLDQLADYLELDAVLAGLAELSEEVFGVRLAAHPERRGWHPDVRPFDMVDAASGRVVARLFIDPYVRHGKQPGAWVEVLLPGGGRNGEPRPPTMSLVLNAPAPATGPSVLSAEEVETLFHEYGHALNFGLGAGRFVLHRGQWLKFDFVEGPSSFLGRWGLQPAVMSRFARHRETGAPIPQALLDGLVRAESLNAGFKVQRLLSQGMLDAILHGANPPSIEDANREAWRLRGTPYVEGALFPASLTHFVGGGYDAALYGYSWSEVIRDDLLERFEAGGLTSPAMGAAYRSTILEVPWTSDTVAAVNAFLGRRWSADAFLARVRRPV